MPLRQGRNASQLAACSQQDEISAKQQIKEEKKLWEEEIAQYTGEDPLDLWSRYVAWAQQKYVDGKGRQKLIVLIERCTKIFSGESLPLYREDPRLLHVWLAYTDYCENPLEVFNYMKSNKIGEKEAIFYDRWASVLEFRGNQALCQKVYEAGFHKGAQPAEWLKARFKAFQKRVIKQIKSSTSEEQRIAPAASLGSSTSRTALAPLSSRTTLRPPSALSSSTSLPNNGTIAGGRLPPTSGLGASASLGRVSSRAAATRTAAKATVYVDPVHAHSVTLTGGHQQLLPHTALARPEDELSEGKWHTLAPLRERQKENVPLPQKWSETTVPQKKASKHPPTESFSVFVDEQFQ